MEYKAIKKALYYLDHSLFRDYAGALQIIDKIFESKKIKSSVFIFSSPASGAIVERVIGPLEGF